MTVLITMAGLGSRFARNGYLVPKYQVLARGRTLFEWSMHSLSDFHSQAFVLATLAGEDETWLTAKAHELGVRDVVVRARSSLSSGQAETAYDATEGLPAKSPLWIYNIDTYVAEGMGASDMDGAKGCLHVFPSSNSGMSFVRYGDGDAVLEVAEKRVISNWATVGMYGFESIGLFRDLYEAGYRRDEIPIVGGERYIAPLYQLLIARDGLVKAPRLAAEHVHVLGTPAEVQAFDPAALPPTGSSA